MKAVQLSYNILKPTSSHTLSQDWVKKNSQTLDEIKVASEINIKDGKILVNVLNIDFEIEIKESFVSIFSGIFRLDEVNKTHAYNHDYKSSGWHESWSTCVTNLW